jgi:periplasmic protein TonB
METNKILSANLLDIIFDDRNKDYGAYELRKTYQKRITKALLVTASISLLIFAGSVLARSSKLISTHGFITKELTITELAEEKKLELPKPYRESQPVQTRTVIYTAPIIVDKVDKPLPTQEDLTHANIDIVKQDGIDPNGVAHPNDIDSGKGIIETKRVGEPDIFTAVEVDAKFNGNWVKFLTRNLNPSIPIDNGAPAGAYKVIIQFVVDLDGNLSDIKALTSYGYGMEQEAIRVVKKANGWEPAFQNGRHVKAYRMQPITFVVAEE